MTDPTLFDEPGIAPVQVSETGTHLVPDGSSFVNHTTLCGITNRPGQIISHVHTNFAVQHSAAGARICIQCATAAGLWW
jgi:hypothetical protein